MADATMTFIRDIAIIDRVFATLLGEDEDNFVGGRNLYLFSTVYKADNSKNIKCSYRTKRLDFTDQDSEGLNQWKTVDKVQLTYRDRDADTPITIYVSDDGGVTWVYTSRTIGTGDGKTKTADFWFLDKEQITSQFFTFKIECDSNDTTFEWNALSVYYTPRGEYFEVS